MDEEGDIQASLSQAFRDRVDAETDCDQLWEEYVLLKRLQFSQHYSQQEVEEINLKASYIRKRMDELA